METVFVQRFVAGSYQVNTYVVGCLETRKGVIIDPGSGDETLVAQIRSLDMGIDYVLNTHGHPDHTFGNETFKSLFDVPLGMHEADVRFFSDTSQLDPMDIRLRHGDTIPVGNLTIEVIHTPGHTPGSVCFYVHGHLFTGDTLFVGDVGRTDLAGGSLETLLKSIQDQLLGLPEKTIIWPGHDYGESPTSTMGREIRTNPYITDFILDV